ncbi:MAG TPA: 7-cyano-7-deazaguanine synthase QueC [Thermoanaerobaculia bacterium]|nr:7-cyano-7-deazaguanine synthase QueC [Thermoanaerobaculia bacterium]
MKAVVLLSGGADSATCLALARAKGRETYALSFDYGQRHRVELAFARKLARRFGCVEHRIAAVDLPGKARSALTSRKIAVPRGGVRRGRIPATYVPARNALFLAHALSWAEAIGAREIWIGANVVDYSGYPDCRPAFLRAFERMANLGTAAGVRGRRFRIVAPLLKLSKTEILRLGESLGLDYRWTLSCYDPGKRGEPCGHCDSCRIRQRAEKAVRKLP